MALVNSSSYVPAACTTLVNFALVLDCMPQGKRLDPYTILVLGPLMGKFPKDTFRKNQPSIQAAIAKADLGVKFIAVDTCDFTLLKRKVVALSSTLTVPLAAEITGTSNVTATLVLSSVEGIKVDSMITLLDSSVTPSVTEAVWVTAINVATNEVTIQRNPANLAAPMGVMPAFPVGTKIMAQPKSMVLNPDNCGNSSQCTVMVEQDECCTYSIARLTDCYKMSNNHCLPKLVTGASDPKKLGKTEFYKQFITRLENALLYGSGLRPVTAGGDTITTIFGLNSWIPTFTQVPNVSGCCIQSWVDLFSNVANILLDDASDEAKKEYVVLSARNPLSRFLATQNPMFTMNASWSDVKSALDVSGLQKLGELYNGVKMLDWNGIKFYFVESKFMNDTHPNSMLFLNPGTIQIFYQAEEPKLGLNGEVIGKNFGMYRLRDNTKQINLDDTNCEPTYTWEMHLQQIFTCEQNNAFVTFVDDCVIC